MRSRLAVWVCLVLGAVWLVLIGGGWLGIYASVARIITMTITAALLIGWGVVARRNPAWRPRSVLLPALLLCLLSLGISTVFSRSPRVSLEYLAYAIVLVLLYLLLVRLMADRFFGRRLMVLGALMFVGLTVVYVGAVLVEWVNWWGLLGRVSVPPLRPWFIGLTYGNPSAVLTMVALLAVPTAAVIPRRHRVVGVGLVLVGVALVALLSGSRSGWLALAIGGILAIVAATLTAQGREAIRQLFAWVASPSHRGRAVVLAGSGLLLAALIIRLLPAVLGRVGAGGEDLRVTFWVAAARLFEQSPIVGVGPGMWVVDRLVATQAGEPDFYVPHAHDVPLQALAELGIVGALAGLVAVAAVAWLLWSAWRRGDSERRWLAWLTFAGLAYLALHDVLDFYPNMPAVMFAGALPVAYLDATTDPSQLGGRVRGRPARIATLLAGRRLGAVTTAIATLCCLGLIAQEVPALANDRAVAAADSGQWDLAIGPARTAAGLDPGIHVYQMTLGLAEAQAGDRSAAAADFEVVATSDDLPEAWLDLAAMESDQGQVQPALDALDRSMRLGRQRPQVALAAGDLYRRLGAAPSAIAAFADAIAEEPSLAADPWWHADSLDQMYADAITAAMAQADPEAAWQIALMSGAPDRARALAAAAARPALDLLVIDAWTGDGAALDELLATCRGDPLDAPSLGWCTRAARHAGLSADAEAFRGLLAAESGTAADQAYEWRVDTTGSGAAPVIPESSFWGTYTYRRQTPLDLFVPGLVHLVLR